MAAVFARYLRAKYLLARAVDSDYGLDIAKEFATGETGQPATSGNHQIPGKRLTPRISNLTPWPYIAIALITTIFLVALGYAIHNCYRKTRTRSAGVGLQRISLIERRKISPAFPQPDLRSPAKSHTSLVNPALAPNQETSKDDSNLPLHSTIALPSSCHIPYTPTSVSLAPLDGRRGDRSRTRVKPTLWCKTKPAIAAFKRRESRI